MTEPTPVPPDLLKDLPQRARKVLSHLQVTSCEHLSSLGKEDFSLVPGCGKSTIRLLELLQDRIRLASLAHSPSETSPFLPIDETAASSPPAPIVLAPAPWSILHNPLSTLFDGAGAPYHCETTCNLKLPAADLERLRAAAIFPEDAPHLLYSLSAGYLLEAGLSDSALSALLCALARSTGIPADLLHSGFAVNVSDLSLYAGFPPDLLDPLFVPDFPFPALLDAVVGDADAVSWGLVAKITERDVVQRLGLSATALRAIRYLWQLQVRAVRIAESAAAGLPTALYRDLDQLIERYLQLTIPVKSRRPPTSTQRELSLRLLWGRLGLHGHSKTQLHLIGEEFGISRERVRQVETELNGALKKPGNLRLLEYLWPWFDRLLVSGGGGRYVSELCLSLQRLLHLALPPSEHLIAAVLGFSPRYRVVWDPPPIRAALAVTSCVDCPTARSVVFDAVKSSEHGALSFHCAREVMLNACKEGGCSALRKVTSFSWSLLDFFADSTPKLDVHDRTLHLDLRRSGRKSPLMVELEAIVRSEPEGIHFLEAYERLKRAVPVHGTSAHSVHSRLSAIKWAVLWGYGTFKHRELLSIPVPLITEIQKELAARLDRYNIPYLCVNGDVFDQYSKKLQAEGVPTSRAFYSCMKIVGNPTLSFVDFPYVARAGDLGGKPSIRVLLERFAAKRPGVTSAKDMVAFVVDTLGVPQSQTQYHLRPTCNIFKIGDLRLHLDNAPFVTDQLRRIVGAPPSSDEGVGPMKDRLFQKHKEACEAIGITGGNALRILVEHFFPGAIDWSLKPRRVCRRRKRLKVRQEERQDACASAPSPSPSTATLPLPSASPDLRSAKGAQLPPDWVISYLVDLAKPCRTKDLFNAFRAGPKKISLYKCWLGDRNKVLWYERDAVIARDCLEWCEEKQAAVEALARKHLEACGRPYGSCAEICRDMAGELAEPAPRLSWTPILLHGLLVSGSNFIAVGRHRDLFVSTDNLDGIATLDDLLYHSLITDYGGTASKRAFVAAHGKNGIHLVRSMGFLAGKDPRVVVDGDLMRAAHLVAAAGGEGATDGGTVGAS